MKKAIGVLGGMGPQASAYLYELLIEKSVECFSAQNNEDFPEIILHSVPVSDFISSNKKREEALLMLKERVEKLNALSISCLSIACNTAHILLPQLQAVSKVPFVSMVEEVAKQVFIGKYKRVGFLGTPSIIKYGLYQNELRKFGIEVIVPDKKKMVIIESIIRNVLRGEILTKDTKQLREIGEGFRMNGAQAIILGCTELPLVSPKNYKLPVYSSLEILAMALLRKYYK